MKIDHVSLALFAWEGIPATSYHAGAAVRGGASALGLLRIGTNAGVEGHAFLGSAMHTAENDGPGLVRFLKPLLMGQDPLDRERLNAARGFQNLVPDAAQGHPHKLADARLIIDDEYHGRRSHRSASQGSQLSVL